MLTPKKDEGFMHPLGEFILITEVVEGSQLAEGIFQRKYGTQAPRHGHHIFALYQCPDHSWMPVSYLNYLEHGDVMLAGGACTDGNVIRAMSAGQQEAIKQSQGLYFYLAEYATKRYTSNKYATFAYCGDARAWEVSERLGYERTDHSYVIVRWHNKPSLSSAQALIDDIKSLGPF